MRTYFFKIGFLVTFLLAIYYIVALFFYLPNDSASYSKNSMELACYYYLLIQLFVSVALLVLVIVGNSQVLTGIPKQNRNHLREELILDELEAPINDPLAAVKRTDIQFVRGLNFMNIVPTATLFFLLWLWRNDTLVIVLTLVWAIIQGLLGFIMMFVKEDINDE